MSATLFRLPALLLLAAAAASAQEAQQPLPGKEQILWEKLERFVENESRGLDGVLGVAVRDLQTGHTLTLHADEVFPTASTIKIAILAELCRQAQRGRLKLSDPYTVDRRDLVGGSGIAGALTPGSTRLTLGDVAVLMVSVSDNSMTNVLIDRVGLENVNRLLDSLNLTRTRLRRRMMDVEAAAQGRENVASPAELVELLEALYRGKVLDQEHTARFFDLLSLHKESYLPRELPEELRVANKPGELEGVRNDCGLVFARRPYAICVMSSYLR